MTVHAPAAGGLLFALLPLTLCGSVLACLAVGAVVEPGVGVVAFPLVFAFAVWRIARCSWHVDDGLLTVRGYLRSRTVRLRRGVRISVATPWWAKRGTYVLVVVDDADPVRIPSTYHFSRRARERELDDLKRQTKLRAASVAAYTL